jgi:methanogenic corrinoid protein MtbC1
MAVDLVQLIVDLDKDTAALEIKRRAEEGVPALVILDECKKGMTIVGEKFQAGEAYLAELVLSGEIFKSAMQTLKPYFAAGNTGEAKGKVLLATLKGDIHYLGKGIVAVLLKAYGFEVEDMGEDIEPTAFVEKMKKYKPEFVGFSSLLTPNMKEMKKTVDLMKEAGIRDSVKVMIGGGITSEISREFVGADFQTTEAMAGVQYCCDIVAAIKKTE